MLDKVRKQKIGNEEYAFKMTNKTILQVEERFGNYAKIIDGLMEGKQFYTNAVKILSCSCHEKEFTVDELLEQLTPQQLNMEIPRFVTELYLDYMGINDDSEKEEKKEDFQEKN